MPFIDFQFGNWTRYDQFRGMRGTIRKIEKNSQVDHDQIQAPGIKHLHFIFLEEA